MKGLGNGVMIYFTILTWPLSSFYSNIIIFENFLQGNEWQENEGGTVVIFFLVEVFIQDVDVLNVFCFAKFLCRFWNDRGLEFFEFNLNGNETSLEIMENKIDFSSRRGTVEIDFKILSIK